MQNLVSSRNKYRLHHVSVIHPLLFLLGTAFCTMVKKKIKKIKKIKSASGDVTKGTGKAGVRPCEDRV